MWRTQRILQPLRHPVRRFLAQLAQHDSGRLTEGGDRSN